MTKPLEERLTNLEVKASFAEDLLDKLDQIIIRQQDQIDRLTREVQWLSQQAPPDAATASRNLRDDLPPHY
ncbi:SlyX family protein [Rhodoferax sp.]|uniref:SlyX family protein n=1 Tax=Rhodoferax sp. TaxID=50421 RepID=UPI0025D691BE|nr:SlyX family protein [Rhodoferax sp.]MCM2295241.1 SlyX family protein [Rhodoferax sp.]